MREGQRGETIVSECFLMSFLRDRSLIDLQLLPGQWHSQPSLGSCTFEKMAGIFYVSLQYREDRTDTE